MRHSWIHASHEGRDALDQTGKANWARQFKTQKLRSLDGAATAIGSPLENDKRRDMQRTFAPGDGFPLPWEGICCCTRGDKLVLQLQSA